MPHKYDPRTSALELEELELELELLVLDRLDWLLIEEVDDGLDDDGLLAEDGLELERLLGEDSEEALDPD